MEVTIATVSPRPDNFVGLLGKLMLVVCWLVSRDHAWTVFLDRK